jgi:small-conductance mechanosensitive channel
MDKIKQVLPDAYEHLGIFLLIIALTVLAEWLTRRAFNRFIRIQTSDIQNDPTSYKFLGNALRTIIYTVGIGLAIRQYPPLQALASSLLAGAGILAVAIGFASQQAFSNIVSGIFIVMFKPFRVNDRLRVKENYTGTVEDITLRHTVIRDNENRRIIVPNSVIATEILVNANQGDGKVCKFLEFSVAMNSDIDKVRKIIAEEIEKHPLSIDPRSEAEIAAGKPLVEVRLTRFTDFAMVIRGYVWTYGKAAETHMELLESVKKRFDTEGVEMPYPHHVILKKTL